MAVAKRYHCSEQESATARRTIFKPSQFEFIENDHRLSVERSQNITSTQIGESHDTCNISSVRGLSSERSGKSARLNYCLIELTGGSHLVDDSVT